MHVRSRKYRGRKTVLFLALAILLCGFVPGRVDAASLVKDATLTVKQTVTGTSNGTSEKFEYEFVKETGVRVIIGKGGMKENTERACKDFGAIHCVFPAGNAVVAATEVEEIVRAEWRDLGMPETLWNCRVKEFGPLIVSIDPEGNNFFEQQKVEYNKRKDEQIEKISAQVGFIK
mgnify:CR=1 FL=1